MAGPAGRFQICRHDDAAATAQGELALVADDGTRQGEHLLKVLLAEMDESIFNNVFGISLEELQELATLGDTQAAQLLYDLTAGLDRVSLVEVMRELERSRQRILASDGQSCQIVQLLAEREKLRDRDRRTRAAQSPLRPPGGRPGPARSRSRPAGRGKDASPIPRPADRAGHRLAAALATAGRVGPPARASRRGKIDSRGGNPAARRPERPAAQVSAAAGRLPAAARAVSQGRGRPGGQRSAVAAVGADRSPGRAAVVDQEHHRTAAEIEANVAVGQQELESQGKQLGLNVDPRSLPRSPPAECGRFVPLRGRCGRRISARRRPRSRRPPRQAAEALDAQLTAALESHGQRDLAAAMDRIGGEVAQFRRRVQIDERLEELGRSQNEMKDEGHEALHAQLLPVWRWPPWGECSSAGRC